MEPVTFEEPVEYDPTVAKDGEDDAPMRFNNPRFRRIGRQEMMSCWRQYTIFIIGSAIVALCTVTTITLLSEAANALLANVALMCWAGAVPFSFVLHIVTRTLVRTLRKKRALARGKRVDGDRSLIVDDVLFDAEDGGGAAAARRLQRMVSAMYLDPAEIALQLNAPRRRLHPRRRRRPRRRRPRRSDAPRLGSHRLEASLVAADAEGEGAGGGAGAGARGGAHPRRHQDGEQAPEHLGVRRPTVPTCP